MSRYIDKDALIEAMGEEPYVWMDSAEEIAERNQWLTDMHIIEEAPSIEPKRGEWIDYSCGSGCYCSNCGWDGDDIIDECIIQDFDFCPTCGARMKGADDDRND